MTDALTRRSLLTAAAATAGAVALPRAGRAAAPIARMQGPGAYRYKLGDYQLTALYDGTWFLPIDDKFMRNASGAEVNAALGGGFPAAARAAGHLHRAPGQYRQAS